MNKRNISCVNCGACITACHKELGKGKGLFHFQSGEENSAVRCGESQSKGSAQSCNKRISAIQT
jgi:ferredoxin